jgi:hypothetical protein
MGNGKISAPVAGVIVAIVLLVVVVMGYRFLNPPQQLGPEAKAIMDSMNRARAGQR